MNDIDDAIAAAMSDVLLVLDIDPMDIDIDLYGHVALGAITALKTRVTQLETIIAVRNSIITELEAEIVECQLQIDELEAAEKELEHQNELRENLAKLAKIQSQEGNWNYSEYMRGLANGLLLATTTMNDEATYEPFMYPDIWIEDMERTPPTEAPAP